MFSVVANYAEWEVAYRMGFITKDQLLVLADKYAKSGYGEYLRRLK